MQPGPRSVIIRLEEPYLRRIIQVGKVCLVKSVWTFRMDLDPRHDKMRNLDAVGFAPPVLALLQDWGVEQLHVKLKDRPGVLATTLSEVLKYGRLAAYGRRTTEYYHLWVREFRLIQDYKSEFVTPALQLPWGARPEIAKQAEQGVLL